MAAATANERWSLAGATALVTGGSKGIAGTPSWRSWRRSARMCTPCSSNVGELEECRRRWTEEKGRLQVTVSICDVGVRANREALMDTVMDVFAGKLDILVIFKPATECTAEDYARMMANNLESCSHLSQLAHPLLWKSAVAGGGSIVHISVGSCLGAPNMAIYATAKGGMNQLTRSLAMEWASDKIRVNCVAPGTVVTDMTKQVPFILEKGNLSRIPLQRSGEAEEISSAVAFLCMPAASYVTSQVIYVDGGRTISAA